MPPRHCRLAVVQHPPVFLNLARSFERAVELIRDALAHGAQCIVFPETWLPGYPVWLDEAPTAGLWDYAPAKALHQVLSDNAITVPGPELDGLRTLAREGAATIVMGAHERVGGTLYNTMLLVGADGSYRLHRKLMPTYTERLVWGMGDGSTLEPLETPFGRIGGLICGEHWMPLARAAMHAKRETIHVAQWPGVKELHLLASRHYAFEGQCFVAVAGAVLTRGDVLAGFDSLGLGPTPRGRSSKRSRATMPRCSSAAAARSWRPTRHISPGRRRRKRPRSTPIWTSDASRKATSHWTWMATTRGPTSSS